MNPLHDVLPQAGGSFARDPVTGELTPNAPSPQDAPPAVPDAAVGTLPSAN